MNPRVFREAIRTVMVSYPIPFIFAALLAFSLCCFGLALLAVAGRRELLTIVATVAAVGAIALAAYGAVFRNELLRSERRSLINRYLDILVDSDVDPATRDSMARTISGSAAPEGTKHATSDAAAAAEGKQHDVR